MAYLAPEHAADLADFRREMETKSPEDIAYHVGYVLGTYASLVETLRTQLPPELASTLGALGSLSARWGVAYAEAHRWRREAEAATQHLAALEAALLRAAEAPRR